jgi:hypothetical protein
MDAQAGQEMRLAATQDQLKQVDRVLATSQKAMQLAQAKAGDVGRSFAKTLSRVGYRSGSASRALVIPKDPTDPKTLTEVEEDMNVMAHILDKAASDDRKSPRAMGIPVFVRIPGGGSPQNLYIEGSGALFFLNVNYPLQPATEKDTAADAKEKTNSEWDEAKREMGRSTGGGGADAFVSLGESFERNFNWDGRDPSPYDADQVEDLKTGLISALKNAAHIRKLKSDETVTVVVTGATAGGGAKTIRSTGHAAGKGGPVVVDPTSGLPVEPDAEAVVIESTSGERGFPAKMVLRMRKADAEAFQNGKLSLDEFKKKVTVMIY